MTHYECIVIGGGVIGCSIAYRLARSGRSVALFDSAEAGRASLAAGGMLGAQNEFEAENPLMDIALESRALFSSLGDELLEQSGIDIELKEAGLLKVAALEEDRAALQDQYAFLAEKDASVLWLEPEDIPGAEPRLTGETAGAIYLQKDNQVKAPLLAQAFLRAAVNAGVHVYEHTSVRKIEVAEGRAVGIRTDRRFFGTNQIVAAAGAWSASLLAGTGFAPPVVPVKGECVSVKVAAPPAKTVFAVDGCYIVPKRNGEMLIGATSVEGSFDCSVTAGGVRSLLNRAARLLPLLDDGTIERTWAGIRPQTADHLPIMGTHPLIEGLYLCTGHYRNGILLSPAAGLLMEKYISGCPDTAERLAPFSPARFFNHKEVLPV